MNFKDLENYIDINQEDMENIHLKRYKNSFITLC